MLLEAHRGVVAEKIALSDQGSLFCDRVDQPLVGVLEDAPKEICIERRVLLMELRSKVQGFRDAGAGSENKNRSLAWGSLWLLGFGAHSSCGSRVIDVQTQAPAIGA